MANVLAISAIVPDGYLYLSEWQTYHFRSTFHLQPYTFHLQPSAFYLIT
jgi:hypothetical protein